MKGLEKPAEADSKLLKKKPVGGSNPLTPTSIKARSVLMNGLPALFYGIGQKTFSLTFTS
jgi:hypothetical protein